MILKTRAARARAKRRREEHSPRQPTPADYRRIYAKLAKRYALPRMRDWGAAITAGFTTDGPSAPWPLKGTVRFLCGVDCGGPDDTSWPPKPFSLHDYLFWLGGGLGAFWKANRALRDYLLALCREFADPELWPDWRIRLRVGLVVLVVESRLAWSHFGWRRGEGKA